MPILAYTPGDSILHKLNPITKLTIIVLVWITSLVSFDMTTFLILLFLLMIFWALGKISLKEMAALIKLLLLIFLVFTIINGFMYFRGKTPLFYVVGYPFTLEGLLFGITLSLKVLCIVLSIPILTRTTTMSELIGSFAEMRVPYTLTFILATAINFTDMINEIYQNIKESQLLRGYSIDEMNFLKRIIKGYAPLFVPLILLVLKKASTMDLAIEARSFGVSKKRTYVNELKFTIYDIMFISIALVISIVLLVSNIIYGKTMLILPV
jgi:energy-coupling factor transport system permease protein